LPALLLHLGVNRARHSLMFVVLAFLTIISTNYMIGNSN